MNTCSNHKKDIAGITDMKQLAEMIGDLHYEALADLMYQLELKILKDAKNDLQAGRNELGGTLKDLYLSMITVSANAHKVWQISKPFMQPEK